MPSYTPIEIDVPLQASLSDLAHLNWSPSAVTADFILPDDRRRLLRVSLDRQCIVRLVDEMPLSTEYDDGPITGLVPEHFAHRVVGAAFARMQSDAWKAAVGPVTHYRFITGWTCLDVLSAAAPYFDLIAVH